MQPELTDLYAGFSGFVLVPKSFDLGQGVVISQTYAHFMAPFLMAFTPPAPGKPHPPPWKAAKGGLGIDITAELYFPIDFRLESLDRLNSIWWIAALLRLKATTRVFVPVVSTERFASIPHIQQEPELLPIEIHTNRLFLEREGQPKVDSDDLEWIKAHWIKAADLLKNEDFSVALQAIDSCIWNSSPDLALVSVWGALERLFSTSHQELRFRVSANIASFLEPPGRERYKCFKQAKALYDQRSKSAHGSGSEGLGPLVETYALARRAFKKMIETHCVPKKSELDARLFGDEMGITNGESSNVQ